MYKTNESVVFVEKYSYADVGDYGTINAVNHKDMTYTVKLFKSINGERVAVQGVPESAIRLGTTEERNGSFKIFPKLNFAGFNPAYSAFDAKMTEITREAIENMDFSKLVFDRNYDYTIYTDENIDYEAISKEPVYYEFVDVGKALNKLKYIEHSKQPVKNIDNSIPSDCTKTYTEEKVMYIVNNGRAYPMYVQKEEYRNKELVKIYYIDYKGVYMNINPIGLRNIFSTLKEALEFLGTPF